MAPENIDRMSNIRSKVRDLICAASNDVSGTACNTVPNPHGFNEANFPDN
jgi:hypothetical protein